MWNGFWNELWNECETDRIVKRIVKGCDIMWNVLWNEYVAVRELLWHCATQWPVSHREMKQVYNLNWFVPLGYFPSSDESGHYFTGIKWSRLIEANKETI